MRFDGSSSEDGLRSSIESDETTDTEIDLESDSKCDSDECDDSEGRTESEGTDVEGTDADDYVITNGRLLIFNPLCTMKPTSD